MAENLFYRYSLGLNFFTVLLTLQADAVQNSSRYIGCKYF